MLEIVSKIIIILLGITGFGISYYIFKHKRKKKEPMICPMKFKCDDVIHSKYSKLFGLPLEYWGMLYYALIALSYLLFSFYEYAVPIEMTIAVLIATAIAFIVSIYLLYIQAFVLKQWCSWCIASAGFSVLIFIFAFFA